MLGIASGTVGMVFQFLTTATFTLYFAADAPKIRRALLVRMPPERQQRMGWAWDTAIEQTGGYFYSRLVLLLINATLFFFVMVAVGVPWLVALPLAVFQGFFAEFIPVVGTYIGAAIPALVTLGIEGVWQALVLVAWTRGLPADRELLAQPEAQRPEHGDQRWCRLRIGPGRWGDRRTDGCVHGHAGRCPGHLVREELRAPLPVGLPIGLRPGRDRRLTCPPRRLRCRRNSR